MIYGFGCIDGGHPADGRNHSHSSCSQAPEETAMPKERRSSSHSPGKYSTGYSSRTHSSHHSSKSRPHSGTSGDANSSLRVSSVSRSEHRPLGYSEYKHSHTRSSGSSHKDVRKGTDSGCTRVGTMVPQAVGPLGIWTPPQKNHPGGRRRVSAPTWSLPSSQRG